MVVGKLKRQLIGMGKKCAFCRTTFKKGEVSKWVMTSDRYPKECCASCYRAMK